MLFSDLLRYQTAMKNARVDIKSTADLGKVSDRQMRGGAQWNSTQQTKVINLSMNTIL